MAYVIDDRLTEAVVAFVGTPGRLSVPSSDEIVYATFGDAAKDLLARVKAIVDPLYDADPPLWHGLESDQIYPSISAFVSSRHPELGPEAVRAIANGYCFDWK